MNNEIDKYANETLLPEMKKVFSKSNIKKEIIGEVTGFDRVKKSEACELVSQVLILGSIDKDGKVILVHPSQKSENGLPIA